MRVIIVGGGIMGASLAQALKAKGALPVVIERRRLGAEASRAAAGMLGAQLEESTEEELVRYVRARDGYGDWARELLESTGIDIGYRKVGALCVATEEGMLLPMKRRATTHAKHGFRASVLAREIAVREEPSLAPSCAGALHFPDEAVVEPERLMQALRTSLERLGVDIREGVLAHGVLRERGRARGVHTSVGRIEGDAVVVAAGAWTPQIEGLASELLDVEPVRGAAVTVREFAPRLGMICIAGPTYLVPRGDGRVVIGATTERVGFDRAVAEGTSQWLWRNGAALVPHLSRGELLETRVGFRPFRACGPKEGATSVGGLFVSCGHYRNGILLAKDAAERLSQRILGG